MRESLELGEIHSVLPDDLTGSAEKFEDFLHLVQFIATREQWLSQLMRLAFFLRSREELGEHATGGPDVHSGAVVLRAEQQLGCAIP